MSSKRTSYNFRSRDSRCHEERTQDTSVSGSSLLKTGRSPSHRSSHSSAGSSSPALSYNHSHHSASPPPPLHSRLPTASSRHSDCFQRYSTPDSDGGSCTKYILTIVAFIFAVGMAVAARKSGFSVANSKPEGQDIEYLKSQVEGVKMASAHLHSAKQDMEDIYSQMNYMLGDFKDMAENLEIKNVNKPRSKASPCGINGCLDTDTTALEQRTAEQCDMDNEELADYALESAGGMIVTTGKTQNYREPNEITFLGITLCSSERGPETILQPAVLPGNCWAFKGQSGSVVIQLSTPIQVTGVTIDHISKDISPYELDSAPKEFSLHGTNEDVNNKSKSKVYYGRFVYETAASPSQYFPIDKVTYPVDFVELRIHSNHGNSEYTCLYRIRIHGIPDATINCDDCETENDFG